jgi:hypothetical protein
MMRGEGEEKKCLLHLARRRAALYLARERAKIRADACHAHGDVMKHGQAIINANYKAQVCMFPITFRRRGEIVTLISESKGTKAICGRLSDRYIAAGRGLQLVTVAAQIRCRSWDITVSAQHNALESQTDISSSHKNSCYNKPTPTN